MSMRRTALGLLLVMAELPCLLSGAPLGTDPIAWSEPVPEWCEGPVRYALTSQEVQEFKSLKSPAERSAFIARFWAARDPDPYVPGNTAEEIFWKRVADADELFTATTIAGWRTDRGKVYIVLGPPDEIASYNMPGAGTLDPTHWHDGLKRGPATDLRPGQRGAVEWLYRSLPQPRAAASQVFTFVRDSTGEYFLSGPLAASFQLDLLEAKGQSEDIAMRKSMLQQALGKGMASSNNDARTHTNLMDAPGSLVNQFDESMRGLEDIRSFGEASIFEQAVPPGSTTSVTTRESFGQILVRDQVHFLQDRDGTRVLIDLGLASRELISSPSPPSTSVELYGRLVSTDDPSRAYQFSTLKDSVAAGAPQDLAGEAGRIFQVSGVLAPGKYSATFGIRVGDKTGAVQERLSVPDFSREGLQMADPILAESIARIESQPAAGEFVLGSLQVLPKLEPVYRTGQPLGFYFQGYGAKQSPTDGRVHLDLVYRFHRREKGLYRPFGTPVRLEDTASPTHAYAFSLNGWESGEYLLTVTLLDTVSQEVVSGSAAFLVH